MDKELLQKSQLLPRQYIQKHALEESEKKAPVSPFVTSKYTGKKI